MQILQFTYWFIYPCYVDFFRCPLSLERDFSQLCFTNLSHLPWNRNILLCTYFHNTATDIILFFVPETWSLSVKRPWWYRHMAIKSIYYSYLFNFQIPYVKIERIGTKNWRGHIQTLLKQNLLTCAIAAAVVFKILSLWSSALSETMVPLPESLENCFPEYSQ
jgi:hypothetical protein